MSRRHTHPLGYIQVWDGCPLPILLRRHYFGETPGTGSGSSGGPEDRLSCRRDREESGGLRGQRYDSEGSQRLGVDRRPPDDSFTDPQPESPSMEGRGHRDGDTSNHSSEGLRGHRLWTKRFNGWSPSKM